MRSAVMDGVGEIVYFGDRQHTKHKKENMRVIGLRPEQFGIEVGGHRAGPTRSMLAV